MNKLLAKSALALLLAAAGSDVYAATPTTFNLLSISRADGVEEQLMIHQDLRVELSEEGHILLRHPEITVEYLIDEVDHFSFVRNTDATDTYVGDHQSASISSPKSPEDSISVAPGEIIATGGNDITVYDLKGMSVASARSESGSARIATSSLPKGVYILKSGTTVLKIRL